MSRNTLKNAAATATLCAATCLSATAGAVAQDAVSAFYKGKTITLVVGASAGGGVDLFGRLVARHMPAVIPGSPNMIVQNMPGAGSVVAARHLYTVAPKDGTHMATVLPGAFFQPIFASRPQSPKQAYDPRRFSFIGNGNAEALTCLGRDDAPVKSFPDMFKNEFVVGTPGGGSVVHMYTMSLRNILGARLKIVTGYPGTKEIMHAVQTGELQGVCGLAYASVALQFPGAIHGKDGFKILAQVGSTGHPDLDKAGIPLTITAAKDPRVRQALEIFYSQGMFVRAFIMPPEVPGDRVAAVRTAFIKAIRSPAFQAEAAKLKTEASPQTGEEIEAVVRKVYAAPPEVLTMIRDALAQK